MQWRVETRHVQRAGAMSCRSASPGAVVESRSLGFSPISFTSGWAAALALPLESLARHRGVGWKSPSGWESHKCVNKCNDQSSLLCPENSGLLWMAGGGDCQAASYSRPPSANRGVWEGKALEKVFSKENSCSLSCYSYLCFK